MVAGFEQLLLPLSLKLGDAILPQELFPLALVCRARQQIGSHLARQGGVDFDVLQAVEESEQLIEILLRDGVVLVVVALRAADGKSQPDLAHRARPVNDLVKPDLIEVDARLAIGQSATIESGRDTLFDRGVRQ